MAVLDILVEGTHIHMVLLYRHHSVPLVAYLQVIMLTMGLQLVVEVYHHLVPVVPDQVIVLTMVLQLVVEIYHH